MGIDIQMNKSCEAGIWNTLTLIRMIKMLLPPEANKTSNNDFIETLIKTNICNVILQCNGMV